MVIEESMVDRLAGAARRLQGQGAPQSTAESLTRLAVELVTGADDAGITLQKGRGRLESVAPTSETIARADALQHELCEGPCVDALDADEVETTDLAHDDRWPNWRPQVTEWGVRSMLCAQLRQDDRGLGALNLYSTRPDAFSDDDRAVLRYLASHGAILLSAAHERDGLQRALENRTVIGQAEGLLMERFGVDADTAFTVLVRYSQSTQTKLAVIAHDLVRTRVLPTVESGEADILPT